MYYSIKENQITIVTESAKEIFIGWLIRDFGFKYVEAVKEMNLVFGCADRDAYIKAKRVGSTIALTRKLRHSIYSSYENALNHASTADEMKHAMSMLNAEEDMVTAEMEA